MAGFEPATCSLRVNRTTCCATLAGGAYAPGNIIKKCKLLCAFKAYVLYHIPFIIVYRFDNLFQIFCCAAVYKANMTGGGDLDNPLFNLYFAKYRLFFRALYILLHRFPFSVLKCFSAKNTKILPDKIIGQSVITHF